MGKTYIKGWKTYTKKFDAVVVANKIRNSGKNARVVPSIKNGKVVYSVYHTGIYTVK